MVRTLASILLTLVAGAALACGPGGVENRESTLPDPEQDSLGVLREVSVEATAGDNVTRIELACATDAAETCDALDDDCDEHVDEGCGYGGAAVQITATWGTGADVDLVVTDPSGATLGGESAATSDGALDRASRGACGDTREDAARIEDIAFPAAHEGTYRVALVHRDACVEGDAPPTPASVTVVVGAAIVGTWNTELAPGAHADVVTIAVQTNDAPTDG